MSTTRRQLQFANMIGHLYSLGSFPDIQKVKYDQNEAKTRCLASLWKRLVPNLNLKQDFGDPGQVRTTLWPSPETIEARLVQTWPPPRPRRHRGSPPLVDLPFLYISDTLG